MKAFLLKDEDFECLLERLELAKYRTRDSSPGIDATEAWYKLTPQERELLIDDVHSFFRYQVRRWLDEVRA